MAITYRYDADNNIVNTFPTGVHTFIEVLEHFDNLANDAQVAEGFIDIVHYEGVDSFDFDSQEGMCIAKMHNKLANDKPVKAIIFIGIDDKHFHMASTMKELHKINNPDDDVYVVRSQQDADRIAQTIMSQ